MSKILSFTEENNVDTKEPEAACFATVGAVYNDGLSLIFGSDNTASSKHYKCNRSVIFAAGQRVKVAKDRGTYVVEYAVGNPISKVTVAKASTSATLANVITALNNLNQALKNYGLIG